MLTLLTDSLYLLIGSVNLATNSHMAKMLTCLDIFISISDTGFIKSFTSLYKISQRLISNKLNAHLFYVSIMSLSSLVTNASNNFSIKAEHNSA